MRTGRPTRGWCGTTGVVNHFYFYCLDADFGPFFLKFCSYFPYNAKLCINGNEYAKRQAARAGIGFTALDNGFAAVDDPPAVQAICDRLDRRSDQRAAAQVAGAILPHPFTPTDRAAGYRYDLSILQAEFSLTQMLDRPVVRADLLRAGDPGQPRPGPPRPGRADLRPRPSTAAARTTPRAPSPPGWSPTGSPPACTCSTRTPRSSSTTRKDGHSGPRPRSTTRWTSTCGKG